MSVVEKSIGELLVDNGQISADELRLAEREAKSTGEPLSVILSRLGLAYEHHFKNALELKYGVTYVSLSRTEVHAEILKRVPEAKLREHMMVPVNEKGTRITVVMVNPEHTSGLAALKEYFTDRQFTPVVCTEDDFVLFMSSLYQGHLEARPAQGQESNGAKEEMAAAIVKAKPAEVPAATAEAPESEASSKPAAVESKPAAEPVSEAVAAVAAEKPKSEIGIPTNDETGKFDLNMLQKHIEQTRSKAGKKPPEETSKETEPASPKESPKDESAATPAEEKPAEPKEEKPPVAEVKPEPAVETKPEPASETKPAAVLEPEPKAVLPPEPKAEARPDAKDVARLLAKEMAEESKGHATAIRDDEATGEFDAMKNPVTTIAGVKQEAKEEPAAKVEPSPAEPAPNEAPKEKAEPEKSSAEKLDQTGQDLKAVSPKTGSEAGFGECEPVASELVARPAATEQKPADNLDKEGDDAAVIMLCNQILANGIAKGASTIHVETVDKQVMVHYRIQGQLMVVRKLPKMLMPALTARFRKMARVDTQDKRLPQDGRVKVRMSGKDFSLRLTVVPHTAGGEHISVWIE